MVRPRNNVIKYTNLYTAELFCFGQEKLPFSARITVPIFLGKIVKRNARLFTDLDVRTGFPVCEMDLTTLLRKAHVTVLCMINAQYRDTSFWIAFRRHCGHGIRHGV